VLITEWSSGSRPALTPLGDAPSTAGASYSPSDSLAVRSGCLPE